MKNLIKSVVVLAIFSFVFVSCSEDKDEVLPAKPVITDLEVGGHHDHEHAAKEAEEHEDHAEGHIGEDLHIAATIKAEGKIDYIMVEIHSEDGKLDVLDQKFTEDKGNLNAQFHKHVDIPTKVNGVDLPEGHYHFHLKVVDQSGQTTEAEKELHLEYEEVMITKE